MQGYDVYTNVVYLHVAVVGLLIVGFGVFMLTVNKVQKSKTLKKWVKFLHVSVPAAPSLVACLSCTCTAVCMGADRTLFWSAQMSQVVLGVVVLMICLKQDQEANCIVCS